MWDLSRRSWRRSASATSGGPAEPSPARRVLTAGLGVAAVLATAAVARASGNSGGLFTSGASTAGTPSRPDAAVQGAGQAGASDMSGQGAVVGAGGLKDAIARSTMCTARGREAAALQQPTTAFDGRWWARDKLVIRQFVDPADPAFNQLLGINDAGVVVGYRGSGADAMHPNKGYLAQAPYRRRDIVARNVPGSVQTQEIGINRVGVQVGFSVGKDGVTSGFVRLGEAVRLVHGRPGGARPAVDQLLGINGTGRAVGFSTDAKGASHGYLYDVCTGGFRAVRVPVASSSLQPTGVNASGAVTGFYLTGETMHGFVLDHGRFTKIDLGAKVMTQALGIDDAGDVVGTYTDKRGAAHGFVWVKGRVRTVDVPRAAGGTVVNGVNNRGQLVGYFTTADKRTVGFLAS